MRYLKPQASSPLPPFLEGSAAFIRHYVRRQLPQFIILAVLVISAASCAVAIQYVMKVLVDAMAGPREGSAAQTALAIFISLIAVESILWRLCGWLGCKATLAIGVQMRLDLFDFLNGQPMKYFAENLAGSLGQRVTATAGNFGALTNIVIWRVAPPAVDFIGTVIVFTVVDWRMAVALASAVVVIMGGLLAFGERGKHLHRTYASYANEVGGSLIDVITNMWSIKAFSARSREHARLAASFRAEADAQRDSWMYTEKARLIHDIALWVMAGGMLAWAVRQWSRGEITPGDVVLVSALTFRILHGSRDMALSLVDMVQHFGFIEDTLRIIGQPQTVVDLPGAPAIRPHGGAIEFRKVSFTYGTEVDAIHNLDLSIPAGQKVGIVGPSGAGKSTFVHLLQRLYDVQGGQILIDGQPIASVTQDSLREALAVVPQEILLFHRTVMENIRFARPEASDEEARAAARAAHCEAFISRLHEGYDTVVGERGVKLSGGQRQRIGIARAFLKAAPVIVLDEATSALDTESELVIQASLVKMFRDRTVIAVAHRLSTLSSFDRILVMNGGRVVEDGNAAELRAHGGLFARMWRMQAEGLTLDAAE
ncbi:ABC transporter ATP-binding protein [Mesorhizobium sp. B2-7-3]|uniref:ABC transporter ATP-binding protein n=1 Tax=unclassified Mesorhizobium TaxID=325217 RepID=UPI00112EDC68|nr:MULTISPECIES: ABC transporter ATP-binding protein [unclassified Mesorhizobium]TPJ12309.1 ABC transporter ATP-binding protein [Mesorhizobium sp. B2-7-3]TPL67443.1 ABC transporter ATP-binding protein [Mesorhizobium sp. B2-3-15]TPL99507.1 ABC transporter ATP-binding protein [Mesorhizobium sp. B2-3-10]